MLRERHSRYDYEEPNRSVAYGRTSRPRTIPANAAGSHSTFHPCDHPAPNGGRAKVCPPPAPAR